jgi:DME family drug/metabolite transporter
MSLPMKSPRLQLVLAAALFSTGGAAVKACDLTAWQVACFRSGIAALALLLCVPEARRGWSGRAWLVSLSFAATMVLYVCANKLTTAANAIMLQSTAPLYIVGFGPWLLREPNRPRDLAFLVAMALGLGAFFVSPEAPSASAPDPFTGNLLGVAAGLGWALTVIGMRSLERRGDGSSALAPAALGNIIACVVCLPFAFPVLEATPTDLALVLYLGVFQIGLAYVLISRGIGQVRALEASLLLMIEPLFNPFWAWLVHGETPGDWALLGGALVIGALLARSLAEASFRRPPEVQNEGRPSPNPKEPSR